MAIKFIKDFFEQEKHTYLVYTNPPEKTLESGSGKLSWVRVVTLKVIKT